jgi:hypothetical protein
MRRLAVAALGSTALVLLPAACKTTDNASALREDALIESAPADNRQMLAALKSKCMSCHPHGSDDFETLKTSLQTKFLAPTLAAKKCIATNQPGGGKQILERCFLQPPPGGGSTPNPRKQGLYRAMYSGQRFKSWLEEANGALEEGQRAAFSSRFESLTNRTMPSPDEALSDDDVLAAITWMTSDAGQKFINELTEADVTSYDEGPTTCTGDEISKDLTSHIVEGNAVRGWWSRKLLQDDPIKMFGCARQPSDAGFNPMSDCFADSSKFPRNEGIVSGNALGAKLVRIRDFPKLSSYWMRASPDGRFVGLGGFEGGDGSNESTLEDLAQPAKLKNPAEGRTSGRRLTVNAAYDPSFTPGAPGSDWLAWHGWIGNDLSSILLCKMDHVRDTRVTRVNDDLDAGFCKISDTEGEGRIEEYQSIGTSMTGGLTYLVQGAFQNDDGGQVDGGRRINPPIDPGDKELRIFSFDGARVTKLRSIPAQSEHDWVVSPSTQLVIGRIGEPGSTRHMGYRVRRIHRETDNGMQDVAGDEVGRICSFEADGKVRFAGAKANWSYDERFVITHSYANENSSDIYLYDLWKKKPHRITELGANKFALYPVFRADGWIYFIVRDHSGQTPQEYLLASDAALKIMAQP